jgi:hypothetical protein
MHLLLLLHLLLLHLLLLDLPQLLHPLAERNGLDHTAGTHRYPSRVAGARIPE